MPDDTSSHTWVGEAPSHTWVGEAVGEGPGEGAPLEDPPEVPERYTLLALLGTGGMGEVWRARDERLRRTVAVKILREHAAREPDARARFVEEAQATAQLQHPGIVPVHDFGTLPDGRLFFAMKEVQGHALGAAISAVHGGPAVEGEGEPWSFRRLVDAWLRVCEAMAYAHERGVLHRDLKPANIMLGAHGEVLVVDWGLARIVAGRDPAPVRTDRSEDDALRTRVGAISGTPAYMAPEQAAGDGDRIGSWTDVYALGCVRYAMLVGRRPFHGASALDVLAAVQDGPPEPVRGLWRPLPTQAELPVELVELCEAAMAREPAARPADAGGLVAPARAWLEGSRRRGRALSMVADALAMRSESHAVAVEARRLAAAAEAALQDVPGFAPAAEKIPAWRDADAAAGERMRSERLRLAESQLLHAALVTSPGLPEAHAALAELHLDEHAQAEAVGDGLATMRAEQLLREHLDALPRDHPVRLRGEAWLSGTGALTLQTLPAGAVVQVRPFVTRDRRLEPGPAVARAVTPVDALPLPPGSFQVTIEHPERALVRYPIQLGRGEHWDGRPPDAHAPAPVHLPRADALGPDDCYVPAGWTRIGHDDGTKTTLAPRRLWVDAFVMARHPVRVREYLDFLNDLVDQDRLPDASRWAPREYGSDPTDPGTALVHWDGVRFGLDVDENGDRWALDWPVLKVDWFGAVAYAEWLAARTGRPWRLPFEVERIKAARGVDGRIYPWGGHYDPSWACNRESHDGRALPAEVQAFEGDVSVYEIRGLSGNMQEWCAERYRPEGHFAHTVEPPPPPGTDAAKADYRVVRGGSWSSTPPMARQFSRGRFTVGAREWYLGFRVCRDLVPALDCRPHPSSAAFRTAAPLTFVG